MQPSPTDRWATETTVNFCAQSNVKYVVLLNRLAPSSKILAQVTKDLKNILTATLGNRVAFSSAFLEGRTVTETQPSSAAAQEVKALVQEINKLLIGRQKNAPKARAS